MKPSPNTSTEEKYIGILLLFCLVFVVGMVFYHTVEDLSLLNAVYFTAMTLTTVGYGDFAPQTAAGKLFTSAYVFIGVGFFLGTAAVVFNSSLHKFHRTKEISNHDSKS